ncbi:hypothetical protein [Paenibacillus pinistramenti]|uniref:hypothetical protein n=1 Tax=Paenibacillus pinistramenti TaxID=1768003 RepID=UPI001108198C|nr:hypothetical protein [Paenibacillus pinistramenti]
MHIRIEPEQLRSAGSGLQRSAEQLHTIAEHINRLLVSFSQDNESAWAAVNAKWEQACRLSEQFGHELLRLGQGLQVRSALDEEADRGAGSADAKGRVSFGQAAALYRTLQLGTDSLILPSAKFSTGVISNPRSAIEAVRRKGAEPGYRIQNAGWDRSLNSIAKPGNSSSSNSSSSNSSSSNSSPADNRILFPGLSRKSAGGKMLLKEAALNPQPWVFTNPASGL